MEPKFQKKKAKKKKGKKKKTLKRTILFLITSYLAFIGEESHKPTRRVLISVHEASHQTN